VVQHRVDRFPDLLERGLTGRVDHHREVMAGDRDERDRHVLLLARHRHDFLPHHRIGTGTAPLVIEDQPLAEQQLRHRIPRRARHVRPGHPSHVTPSIPA